MLTARQGDVGFVRAKIPATATRVPLRSLALGEVTGHSHVVASEDHQGVEMYEAEDGHGRRTFLRVTAEGGISILHEEHAPVWLPSGWAGEVRVAREYDEEVDFRRVVD